jgi:hypothetical protein
MNRLHIRRKTEAITEKSKTNSKLAPISCEFSRRSLETAINLEVLSDTPKLKNDLLSVINVRKNESCPNAEISR